MSLRMLLAEIERLRRPLLCLDTCIILDVIRDPTRHDKQAEYQSASVDLLSALENDRLVSVVAAQVVLELERNRKRVLDETKNILAGLRKKLYRVNNMAGVVGDVARVDLMHFDAYGQRTDSIASRWLDGSKKVDHSADVANRALNRNNMGIAPARRGKSHEDCVVVETYLELVRGLRGRDFAETVVFVFVEHERLR